MPDTSSLKRKRPTRSAASASSHFKREVIDDDAGVKNEIKSEDDSDASLSPPSSDAEEEADIKSEDSKPKKKTPKKRIKVEKAPLNVKPPSTWEKMYALVKQMRQPGNIADRKSVV